MISTAVILAGGRGTRMQALSQNQPKHLIPVHDRPFLAYLIDRIVQAKFTRVVVVVGYKAEQFDKLKDQFSIPLAIVNQVEVMGATSYGTAIPVKAVQSIVQEPFAVISGDNLYSVRDLEAVRDDEGWNWVAGFRHEEPSRFGVLHQDEQGFLKQIVEKPKEFVGDIINVGLYAFQPEIFQALDRIDLSPRGEYELTDAVNLLARDHRVRVRAIQDRWFDFTSPDDVERLSKVLPPPER
jgi:dTDP-glucose pyrophosphorylase